MSIFPKNSWGLNDAVRFVGNGKAYRAENAAAPSSKTDPHPCLPHTLSSSSSWSTYSSPPFSITAILSSQTCEKDSAATCPPHGPPDLGAENEAPFPPPPPPQNPTLPHSTPSFPHGRSSHLSIFPFLLRGSTRPLPPLSSGTADRYLHITFAAAALPLLSSFFPCCLAGCRSSVNTPRAFFLPSTTVCR